MRFQDESDTNIAGRIGDTHKVGAVDLCAGHSLTPYIEVCGNSKTPPDPSPLLGVGGVGSRAVSAGPIGNRGMSKEHTR
jgi:hypothetical protein